MLHALPHALIPMPPKPDTKETVESIARNRRARYDYEILDTWEAGLVLRGTEVKSLRAGQANLNDAFGIVREGEVFLINLHIAPYSHGGRDNHEPTRTRKLLMHAREIRRLIGDGPDVQARRAHPRREGPQVQIMDLLDPGNR